MNIVVNTFATRTSGALTIYKQFVSHLKENIGGNNWYIYVDSSMPQPQMENVTYIYDDNHSWRHRIYWDYAGCMRQLKKKGIVPDVIVSLQNSGCITKCRQVVYHHQSLPLYKKGWSFFKKDERVLAMYKYFYPFIISPTFTKNTDVVVQIPFIKRGFVKKYGHPEDKVYVLFPDVYVQVPQDNEKDEELRRSPYFIYPATGASYKQHRTIVNAVEVAKKKYPEVANKIRVLFTLDKDSNKVLCEYIKAKGCENNFEFIGRVEYNDLMRLVKNTSALLFPSIIETLGLPLIEAATMEKAVVAANEDYAKEVLADYEGVTFLRYDDYESWADNIVKHIENYEQYPVLQQKESTWNNFFALVNESREKDLLTTPTGGVKRLYRLEYIEERRAA